MAAILYLDVDDEITTAVGRIRAATEDRLVLVLPQGSRLATSRINFRLLAREAEMGGRRVDIVATDPAARALAAAAGLAVHASVAAFEMALAGLPGAVGGAAVGSLADAPTEVIPAVTPGTPTRGGIAPPRERAEPIPSVGTRRPRGPGRGLATLLAVVLVLLVGGGYAAFTYLPSATVTLVPREQALGPLELTITAETVVTEANPVALLVPARRFSYEVVATDTFPATGLRVEEAAASGEVTFQNCDTGRRARIPGGSIVATPGGVRFATDETVNVERASVFPFACKVADVRVAATLPGLDGNVGAGAITVIPDGFDPIVLTVTNKAPTSGGKHDEFQQITEVDTTAALETLDLALAAEFERLLADRSAIPPGTTLFLVTARLGDALPSLDPATLVGLEQAEFELGLAAEGTVIGVDPGPIDVLADVKIRSVVHEGYRLDEDSIDTDVGEPIVAGETVTFPVTVVAREVRIVDREALLEAIRGLPIHEARVILDAEGENTITVWPDWVTTIPSLEARLTFTVEAAP